VETSYNRA